MITVLYDLSHLLAQGKALLHDDGSMVIWSKMDAAVSVLFALIDEAFEVSCNTHGTVAVALSVTVTYHRAPDQKSRLRAESVEIHRSAKTGTYEIKVTDEHNALIASCTALSYRKKEKLPFLEAAETG